jgi:hypothetical protein
VTAVVLDRQTVGEMVDRAGRPDYDRWAEQVARCGHCARPVRLRGRITSRQRETYSTDSEPDGVLLVRCRNRRASVCPSCSYEYAGDMWQLLYAGAAGGRKGVPETVRAHPLVFVTLTAPGFGAVHTTRADRQGRRGRCRPWGKDRLCPHRRPTWCTAVHGEDDDRLGTPLCPDCYDYAGHVAFNWHAPELWRRFTITLRRVLARQLGVSVGELAGSARVSFAKVAEFQRRGVVHFHALIRVDGHDYFSRPTLEMTASDLADGIRAAAASVRLLVGVPGFRGPGELAELTQDESDEDKARDQAGPDEHSPRKPVLIADSQGERDRQGAGNEHLREHLPSQARTLLGDQRLARGHAGVLPNRSLLLQFGEQVDVQVIGGTGGELTPERAAAYLAKYATKSAEDFGLGERRLSGLALAGVGVSDHVARIVRTAWELGVADELAGLRRWLHMLGFRGHFATKSRRYSTTLGAIRRERLDYRRRQLEDARPVGVQDRDGSTLVIARWQFAGLGYLTAGDAKLALASAARARERREAARDNQD